METPLQRLMRDIQDSAVRAEQPVESRECTGETLKLYSIEGGTESDQLREAADILEREEQHGWMFSAIHTYHDSDLRTGCHATLTLTKC